MGSQRKMQWAISPYLKALVDADDRNVIKRCNNIFRCPVCNCDVFYRNSSDGKSASFVHHKETDETPYCSQRTNGFGIKINRRKITTPFPVYLTHDGPYFHLNVKLRPIPQAYETLSDSRIYNDQLELNFKISELLNGSLLKPISKPPDRENNYLMTEKTKDNLLLLNDWGNSIDCFERHGSFFEFNSGKKISSGVPIYCDHDYYVLIMNRNLLVDPTLKKLFEEMLVSIEGTLQTQTTTYDIFHIRIPDTITDSLKRFCSKFNNTVQEPINEPCLIWPPAINDDGTYRTIWSNSKNYISINNSLNLDLWIIDEKIRDLSNTEFTRYSKTEMSVEPNYSEYTIMFSNDNGSDSISIDEGSAEDIIDNNDVEFYEKTDDNGTLTRLNGNFLINCHIQKADGRSFLLSGNTINLPQDYTQITLYNHHQKFIGIITKSKQTKTTHIQIKDAIYDRHRCQSPVWMVEKLIQYSKNDPINARIAFRTIKTGTAPVKLIKLLQERI